MTLALDTLDRLKGIYVRGRSQLEDLPSTLGAFLELTWPMRKHLKNAPMLALYRKEILDFFGESLPLSEIKSSRIAEFRAKLIEQPKKSRGAGTLSNQSVDHRLKELGWILNQGKREGYISRKPSIQFCRNYGHRDLNIKLADFKKVIPFMPPPPKPHQAMMWMALNTGMRWGNLREVLWRDIRDNRIAYLPSKGGKPVNVPLLPETIMALEGLEQVEGIPYAFANPKTGRPYTHIKKPLARAIRLAGVPPFTLHVVRHLTTTILLETTKDLDLVRRIVGWSNTVMLDRYGHMSDRFEKAFGRFQERIHED